MEIKKSTELFLNILHLHSGTAATQTVNCVGNRKPDCEGQERGDILFILQIIEKSLIRKAFYICIQ